MSPFLRRLTLGIILKSSLCSQPDSLNVASLDLEGGGMGETLRVLGSWERQHPSVPAPAALLSVGCRRA